MLRQSSDALKNNERFEGFGIEVIHELSLMLGFNYTFELQLDNAYGSLDPKTRQWNGMIRKLLDEVTCALDFVRVYRAVRSVHCTV
jgi:ionotropic kainate glutamate receptor 2